MNTSQPVSSVPKVDFGNNSEPRPSCSNYLSLLKRAVDCPQEFPRAWGGKTPVYLPDEPSSVALKRSGKEQANKRLKQMESVRAILQEQKSTRLMIPGAIVCEDFLVEDRLPVYGEHLHNMGIYIEQPSLFDEAVREMVRLLTKITFMDLTVGVWIWSKDPRLNIVGSIVRYDNLPLYTEEENGVKVGKIALIDLEHTTVLAKYDSLGFYNGIQVLARIFPYHSDLILEEAGKITGSMPDSSVITSVQKESLKGKEYIEKLYISHKDFLIKEKISDKNFEKMFVVSQEQKERISQAIENRILEIREKWLRDSVGRITRIKPIVEAIGRAVLFSRRDSEVYFMFNTPSKKAYIDHVAGVITPILLESLLSRLRFEQKELPPIPKESPAISLIARSLLVDFTNDYNFIVGLYNFAEKYEIWNDHLIDRRFPEVCICAMLDTLVKEKIICSYLHREDSLAFYIQF